MSEHRFWVNIKSRSSTHQ